MWETSNIKMKKNQIPVSTIKKTQTKDSLKKCGNESLSATNEITTCIENEKASMR